MMKRSANHPATIHDVARRSGVSAATVSRVLNNPDLVAPQTRALVQAAIAELNFVPRAAAQNLSNRRTNVIGLLMVEIGWDNFFPPMLHGIEKGCVEYGYDLFIHSTHLRSLVPGGRSSLGEHNTDGLLVFLNPISDAELERLDHKSFPLVLLHRSPPAGLEIPHVVFENKAGARKMTDHLIEVHGFQRIAFLAGPAGNEDAYWRELGYRESLAAHDIPLDPALIRLGGFAEEIAEATTAEWLNAGLDAQAIFAADDDSAYGAIHALNKAGKRIPEDMPIVGFDDSPVSRLLSPPLTTVRAPSEQAGYKAARMLAQRIRGGPVETKALLPTELVIRRSCGCVV
jgi:LacI family transcriptional regulator